MENFMHELVLRFLVGAAWHAIYHDNNCELSVPDALAAIEDLCG